jgi:radical SAM enzyme (TIGR01210 family)
VPEADYGRIGAVLGGLSRVIVESHPRLIGHRVDQFMAALPTRDTPVLEVAMGLETAHPIALERLNKHVTLAQFGAAADALHARGVALRVFLLIAPPFIEPDEQDAWLRRSLDAAFACGAAAVSLIPTRDGNGAVEALARDGHFHPPDLDHIERSAEIALAHAAGRGRVFVDLWDLARFARCPHCLEARRARLHQMNLTQTYVPPPRCPAGAHVATA